MTKYTIARKFENKKGQTVVKRPNIQRLVTPLTLQVSDTQDSTLHVVPSLFVTQDHGSSPRGFHTEGGAADEEKNHSQTCSEHTCGQTCTTI